MNLKEMEQMLESEIKRLNPAKHKELVSQDLLKTTLKNVMMEYLQTVEDGAMDAITQMNQERAKHEANNPMWPVQEVNRLNSEIQHAALNQAMERIYAITESNPMN